MQTTNTSFLDIANVIFIALTAAITIYRFIRNDLITKIQVILKDPVSYPDEQMEIDFVPVIVTNKGIKSVDITKVFLTKNKNEGTMIVLDDPLGKILPVRLEANTSHVFFFEAEQKDSIRKTGHNYVTIQINYKKEKTTVKSDKKDDNNYALAQQYKNFKYTVPRKVKNFTVV